MKWVISPSAFCMGVMVLSEQTFPDSFFSVRHNAVKNFAGTTMFHISSSSSPACPYDFRMPSASPITSSHMYPVTISECRVRSSRTPIRSVIVASSAIFPPFTFSRRSPRCSGSASLSISGSRGGKNACTARRSPPPHDCKHRTQNAVDFAVVCIVSQGFLSQIMTANGPLPLHCSDLPWRCHRIRDRSYQDLPGCAPAGRRVRNSRSSLPLPTWLKSSRGWSTAALGSKAAASDSVVILSAGSVIRQRFLLLTSDAPQENFRGQSQPDGKSSADSNSGIRTLENQTLMTRALTSLRYVTNVTGKVRALPSPCNYNANDTDHHRFGSPEASYANSQSATLCLDQPAGLYPRCCLPFARHHHRLLGARVPFAAGCRRRRHGSRESAGGHAVRSSTADSGATRSNGGQAGSPLLEQLKSQPNNVELLANIANFYYDARQYDDAIHYYQQVLKLQPENVDVRSDMATAYWSENDPDTAIKEFDTVLTYSPGHANSLFNLGVVKWQGKMDPKGAIESWETLLKLNPNSQQGQGFGVNRVTPASTLPLPGRRRARRPDVRVVSSTTVDSRHSTCHWGRVGWATNSSAAVIGL